MSEGGKAAIQADEEVVAASRVRELESRIRDLERLLGRKTMEVEILREALSSARGGKAGLAVAVVITGRFPVKMVADTLGVARSNLVEQVRGSPKPRGRSTSARGTTSCWRSSGSSPMPGRPTATAGPQPC